RPPNPPGPAVATAVAPQPACHPDLGCRPVAGGGHDADQPYLSLAAPQEVPQRLAACGLAAPRLHGEAEVRPGPPQRQAPVLDGDERDIALTPQLPSQSLS